MPTPSDHRRMQLDPHILDFLQMLVAQGGPSLWTLQPTSARDVLLGIQRSVNVPIIPVDIADCTFPGGPTGRIGPHIVRPQGANGALPAVMYFHGGGWFLGDVGTHDRLVREIVIGARVTLVFVEYARPPQAKYPVAIEQAYATTAWIAEHGVEIGVDPLRLVVAGDGVGGNLATVTTLLAKERGGPHIVCQVLLYPVMDANFETQSYRECRAEGTGSLTRRCGGSGTAMCQHPSARSSPSRRCGPRSNNSEDCLQLSS